ncbi:hypothetical protein AVP42_02774 [Agromyces sp. NDB4Y10]|uniref:M23 family metallopeptidase n=1 Tax=Agromyces sp. NDB4Y10 TaxID=1775951 RepID=UPI0007B1B2A9|nr:M23 family metallopeptidase [Agromyces sp. NDB4Y10]KZE92172.1 hypothetical protein AVP42_02774 [Agromyces sp. NDB4Y10]
MAEWQDFYRAPGGAFGILPNSQFYGPQGHRGKDFIHGAGTPIPAYLPGRVASLPRSSVLGRCVVVELDEGRFAGWAHVRGIAVSVGTRVRPGDTLAHVAGAGDSPGTAWAGAHAHTTLGRSVDSIFSGRVEDPMGLIRPAISSAAPAILMVEDDMFSDSDRTRMNNIWAGLFSGASVETDPGVVRRFNYGVLPIVAHNQTLIAQQAARIAALERAVAELAVSTGARIEPPPVLDIPEPPFAEPMMPELPVSVEVDNVDGIEVLNARGGDEGLGEEFGGADGERVER